jgi:hypothetical protein
MNEHKPSIRATKYLLFLNALIWLGFSLIVVLGVHPAMPQSRAISLLLAGLAFMASAVLLILTITLRKFRLAYYMILTVLGTMAVLSITDDFGIADLVFLLVTMATIALLIRDRRWYLREEAESLDES